MSEILLLAGFAGLLVVFLGLTRNNWLAPCVLAPAMFFICACANGYNTLMYGTEVSLEATLLLLAVTLAFAVAGLFASRVMSSGSGADTWHLPEALVRIPNWFMVLAIAFSLLTMILYYRDISSTLSSLGLAGDWNENMNTLRLRTSFKELDEGQGASGLVNFLYKIQTALAFVFSYVGIHNAIRGQRGLKLFLTFIPVAFFAATVLLTGGRMGLIRLFIGSAVIVWVLYHSTRGWTVHIKLSTIVKFLLVLILSSIAFWLAAYVVGRKVSAGPLDYITHYIGFSMVLFSDFLSSPWTVNSNLIGSEMFVGIYNFIGSHFGITDFIYTYHLEWRYIGDLSLGNVYTAYRYWLHDFGKFGMFAISVAYGVFYSVFFEKAVRYRKRRLINYPLLMYSYIAYGVLMLPIRDCLCATEFVITTPFVFLAIYVVGRYIENKNSAHAAAGDVHYGSAQGNR